MYFRGDNIFPPEFDSPPFNILLNNIMVNEDSKSKPILNFIYLESKKKVSRLRIWMITVSE